MKSNYALSPRSHGPAQQVPFPWHMFIEHMWPWYHKKRCVLCPQVLAQSSKHPGNVLHDSSVFCSNEATLGGPLDSFRTEAACQNAQALVRNLDILDPPPNLQNWKRGWTLS